MCYTTEQKSLQFILKFTDLYLQTKSSENVPLKSGGRFSPAGQSFLWTLSLAFINVGLTTVPQQAQQQCQFPATWQGTWYHSGFPHPLNISTNHISSKGTCLQQSGSMFIMADRYGTILIRVTSLEQLSVAEFSGE